MTTLRELLNIRENAQALPIGLRDLKCVPRLLLSAEMRSQTVSNLVKMYEFVVRIGNRPRVAIEQTPQ